MVFEFFSHNYFYFLYVNEKAQGAVYTTADFCCICEDSEDTDTTSFSSRIGEKLIEVTGKLPTLKSSVTKLRNNRRFDSLNSETNLYIPAIENNLLKGKRVSLEINRLEILSFC